MIESMTIVFQPINVLNRPHEYGVSKYTWLIFENYNQSLGNIGQKVYIPYNCQLLIVRLNIRGYHSIDEVYHPKIATYDHFQTRFAIWNKKKGLKIPEIDFYKRRWDLNGTSLKARYSVSLLWGIRNEFQLHST